MDGVTIGNNSNILEGMWSPLCDNNVNVLWRYANNGCQ